MLEKSKLDIFYAAQTHHRDHKMKYHHANIYTGSRDIRAHFFLFLLFKVFWLLTLANWYKWNLLKREWTHKTLHKSRNVVLCYKSRNGGKNTQFSIAKSQKIQTFDIFSLHFIEFPIWLPASLKCKMTLGKSEQHTIMPCQQWIYTTIVDYR